MLAYIVLDAIVLAVMGLLFVLRPQKLSPKPILFVLATLTVLTAIFDTLMIKEGIMVYKSSKILGVHVGLAPIEDFAYTLAAALLIPYLWRFYADKD